jgi:hypothetical protein
MFVQENTSSAKEARVWEGRWVQTALSARLRTCLADECDRYRLEGRKKRKLKCRDLFIFLVF